MKVVARIEDTPAFRAGVLAGDLIIKLDEVSLKGVSLGDAVQKLRGMPNTEVKLTVVRECLGDAPVDMRSAGQPVQPVQPVRQDITERIVIDPGTAGAYHTITDST